jgi:exodeoxyribonuclease VII large subunit
LLAVSRHHVFHEPAYVAQRYRDRIERQRLQMQHGLVALLRERQQRADELSPRLIRHMQVWQQGRAQDIKRLALLLKGLNPLAVLDRGYSITSRQDGAILKDSSRIKAGERVITRLAKGTFESDVVCVLGSR